MRLTLILLCLFWMSAAAQAHDPGEATYIANEAILVEQNEAKVLFDPMPLTGFGTYPDVPQSDIDAMMSGTAPYDGIDLVFVSHAHRDHFSANAMNTYLSAQATVKLVAPSQALEMMQADAAWQDTFLNRITPLDMEYGQAAKSLTIGNISVEAVRIPHAGWPAPQRAVVQNMVYRVDLGGGVIVMHMGDADVNPNHYAPFEEHWQAKTTETNFPPYWFLLSETGKGIATRAVNAEHAIGIHVPIQVPADLAASGEDYFSISGETRPIHSDHQICEAIGYNDTTYTVCTVSAEADIRLFWGRDGEPFGNFDALESYLNTENETLRVAMNAGMYHPDRRPVGLYIENGKQTTGLQTKESHGNFGLLPNGVFFIQDNKARVMETLRFETANITHDYATQSGPMLVIDGQLHPKFQATSTSKRRRNGVGISADGHSVYFVISEEPVNFHDFATLFKDHLGTPNALYLDGNISRLHDPENARSDPGLPMGPIVGVVARN